MKFTWKIFLLLIVFKNFPVAFLDKLGFIRDTVTYYTRSGLKFRARGSSEDMPEIAVVLSGDEYDISKLEMPKGSIIFDVGAHIGTFSVWIAKKYKNYSKIYAYEPDKENFYFLKQNTKLNNIRNVVLTNSAVSNYNGKGFLVTENMKTDAYYLGSKIKGDNCNVVDLVSEIKSYKLEVIDILKLDIEGGEYNLLYDKAVFKKICKVVRYILIECHYIDRKRNEIELISRLTKKFKLLSHKKNVYIMENMVLKDKYYAHE